MLRPCIHAALIRCRRRRLDTSRRRSFSYRAAMRFLRCVYAEWLLLLPRFTRTRLGISLLALGATLIWLGSRGLEPLTVALQAGALAAIIGAAGIAGSERDRAALPTALTHPTTPLAVAAGRWLAAVLLLGNGAALALFLCMAVAGAVAPERLVDLARPGVVRLTAASALELGPALWHYRDIATGDWGAILHALAWSGLGILLASACVA